MQARAGTSYPVFDGVIVAKEHEELLRSAAEQQQVIQDKMTLGGRDRGKRMGRTLEGGQGGAGE
eukprot:767647-Hanusia_phi.AAC.2